MAEPFVGEVRLFPYNFAPRGWAFCDGQIIPISQNTTLYAVVGDTYGGNGQTTMGIPDMQGRSPLHSGRGPGLSMYRLSERGGSSTVNLNRQELPPHKHEVTGVNALGNSHHPENAFLAIDSNQNERVRFTKQEPVDQSTTMSPDVLSSEGKSEAHENRQPYLVVPFCIALDGIFPSRN